MSTSSISFIEKRIIEDIEKKSFPTIKTRFPPEPNGYLHLGHAKSIFFNFRLAEKYQGECNLRFDDTNPETEDQDYVDMIKEDLRWLGVKWAKCCYASDYFDKFYAYAIELIKMGKAYVDEQTSEKIRQDRGDWHNVGTNSIYRDRSVQENLQALTQMKEGHFSDGAAVLRAKIDMSASNVLLRDPILYRIKRISHHQTKNKWIIFPTYDFAHCLSDAIELISHSICTLEFQDNRVLYNWILDNLNIKPRPYQHEFARLNVEGIVLSKRKLMALIKEKLVDGWDDPRMPTLCAFRRRGYPAQALKLFCKRLGISKQDNCVEFAALETCVREILNEKAPRIMAVINPIRLIITNISSEKKYKFLVPRHPFNNDYGTRELTLGRENFICQNDFLEEAAVGYKRLTLGNTVRLRYACVIRAQKIERNEQGKIIGVEAEADLESFNCNSKNFPKPKGVIHWVCKDNSVQAEFRRYSQLFLPQNGKIESDEHLQINPKSLQINYGVMDALSITEMYEQKMAFQCERESYFCIEPLSASTSHPILHETVSLKGTEKYNTI